MYVSMRKFSDGAVSVGRNDEGGIAISSGGIYVDFSEAEARLVIAAIEAVIGGSRKEVHIKCQSVK